MYKVDLLLSTRPPHIEIVYLRLVLLNFGIGSGRGQSTDANCTCIRGYIIQYCYVLHIVVYMYNIFLFDIRIKIQRSYDFFVLIYSVLNTHTIWVIKNTVMYT